MVSVSLRQMLDDADKTGYGVHAFNVNSLEQNQTILEAAAVTDNPVILQASAGTAQICG